MTPPKKSKRGGARPGAGRKPSPYGPTEMAPWRIPSVFAEEIRKQAQKSSRQPGDVYVDALRRGLGIAEAKPPAR